MRSGWGSGMSFVITTMGRRQSGLRRRDWAPASIMAADMCAESEGSVQTDVLNMQILKNITQALERYHMWS